MGNARQFARKILEDKEFAEQVKEHYQQAQELGVENFAKSTGYSCNYQEISMELQKLDDRELRSVEAAGWLDNVKGIGGEQGEGENLQDLEG